MTTKLIPSVLPQPGNVLVASPTEAQRQYQRGWVESARKSDREAESAKARCVCVCACVCVCVCVPKGCRLEWQALQRDLSTFSVDGIWVGKQSNVWFSHAVKVCNSWFTTQLFQHCNFHFQNTFSGGNGFALHCLVYARTSMGGSSYQHAHTVACVCTGGVQENATGEREYMRGKRRERRRRRRRKKKKPISCIFIDRISLYVV